MKKQGVRGKKQEARNKKKKKYLNSSILCLLLLASCFSFSGCQTTRSSRRGSTEGKGQSVETNKDAQEALTSVVESISGQDLTEQDLRRLNKQLRSDKDAQSAVQVLTDSIGGNAAQIKYCPVTGKRYAPHIVKCPEHGVDLKEID